MFKCWYCSTSLPNQASFCVRCGRSQDKCVVCGTVNPGEALFCFQCGTKIKADGPAPMMADEEHDQTRLHFIPEDVRQKKPLPQQPTMDLEQRLRALLQGNMVGFLHGPETGDPRFPLREGENTVGAGNKNSVVLDYDTISWTHALLICRAGRVLLQDSASTNGTFINNQQVVRPVEINHGDTVSFADQDLAVWLAPHYRGSR